MIGRSLVAQIFAAATTRSAQMERRVPCQRTVQRSGSGALGSLEVGSLVYARTSMMADARNPAAALFDCQERKDIQPG